MKIHGHAGLVSFLPAAGGEVWAVEGGNARLAEALIEAAGVTPLYSHLVTRITRDHSSVTGQYSVSYQVGDEASEITARPYDAVVLAAPLESSSIVFDLVPPAATESGPGSSGDEGGGHRSAHEEGGGGGHHVGLGGMPLGSSSEETCRWVRCSDSGSDGTAARDMALSDQLDMGAAEAESSGLSGLSGSSGGSRASARTFQRTVTTYVTGKLQPAFFGVSRLPSEMILFSNDATWPISAISPKGIVTAGNSSSSSGSGVTEDNGLSLTSRGEQQPETIQNLYKVFSGGLLNETFLLAVFGEGFKVLRRKIWRAYPHFNPPEKFAPFTLSPGLCYANTIENSASAMEMSAIAARNCALLVSQHLASRRTGWDQ